MNEPEILHAESLKILAKLSQTPQFSLKPQKKVLSERSNINKCSQNNAIVMSSLKDGKENMVHPWPSLKTPIKTLDEAFEPGTPTSNLRMLVCAASVLPPAEADPIQLSDIEAFRQEEIEEEKEIEVQDIACDEEITSIKSRMLTGRKEKSLGLLCEKFLAFYPENSESGTTIMLDDVVKVLGIGRRRVYDIVNVLESMEMMVRKAKNKYLWFGKSRLKSTLTKLKAVALRVYGENFCHILHRFKSAVLSQKPGSGKESEDVQGKRPNEDELDHLPPATKDSMKKIMDGIVSYDMKCGRSLGILCQKFIMLFMVSKNSIVTLDRAAKLLITEPNEGPCKYKTKVRRLYDIANILISIKFLEKCTCFEDPTKKAAYKWIGFDLSTLDCAEATRKAFEEQELSLTRHSLLVQGRRTELIKKKMKKLECRSMSEQQLTGGRQMGGSLKRAHSTSVVSSETDGFDAEKLEETSENDSPQQILFKERIRDLQKEFPNKLNSDGLLGLLSACNEQNEEKKLPRRSLTSDFDQPPKKPKLEDNSGATTLKIGPLSCNKTTTPILNLGNVRFLANGITNYAKINPPKSSPNVMSPTSVTQKTLSVLKMPKPIKKDAAVGNTQGLTITKPVLITPAKVEGNNFFQIVPVQYNDLLKKANSGQPQIVQIPLFLKRANLPGTKVAIKPNNVKDVKLTTDKAIPIRTTNLAASFKGNKSIQLVPCQNVSVNADSTVNIKPVVNIAPKTSLQSVKSPKPVIIQPSQKVVLKRNESLSAYPELFTPPAQIMKKGVDGKPPATPIIMPKMTPETPSSECALPQNALNVVTRKLMSCQKEL